MDDAYYKELHDAAIKLLGFQLASKRYSFMRDGFDGLIDNEIKKYLSDVNQQATLRNVYLQRRTTNHFQYV